jgi:hypothetical protein
MLAAKRIKAAAIMNIETGSLKRKKKKKFQPFLSSTLFKLGIRVRSWGMLLISLVKASGGRRCSLVNMAAR